MSGDQIRINRIHNRKKLRRYKKVIPVTGDRGIVLVLRGEFGLAKKPRSTSGCPSVNHLDSLWQDACRDPLKKIPCLIYQNMSDKRKNGKAGRELKNHLQKFGTEAMISSIRADNVVALKELLELCDVGYAALNITFQTECKNTSTEIRACMLDAMEKQRMVDKSINISQICMQK